MSGKPKAIEVNLYISAKGHRDLTVGFPELLCFRSHFSRWHSRDHSDRVQQAASQAAGAIRARYWVMWESNVELGVSC